MENIRKFQIINIILAFAGFILIAFGFWLFDQQISMFISLITTFVGCAMALSGVSSMIELIIFSNKMRQ